MRAIGSSDDVTPVDPTRNDDASGVDDELEQLRARERQLQGAYLRDPWNTETQRALVRVQQQIRHREESVQRLADNGPKAPPLDAAEYARHGAGIRWVETPPSAPDDSGHALHGADVVKQQIALTEAAFALGHREPALVIRLGDLRKRLTELQTHHAPRAPVIPAQPPAAPLGHGSCAPPRPIAMPGNATRIADGGVDLETSLQGGAHLTTPELERYIDAYIAYTASRPELRALHDRAVARGPRILADRFEADEGAHARAAMKPHVERQTRWMQVRPPIGVQQHVIIGGMAIHVAEAARIIIALAPGAGKGIDAALSLIEWASGRSLGGLVPSELTRVDDVLGALAILGPAAGKLLNGGAAGAANIVRIARATGHTEAEVRLLLRGAEQFERDKPLLVSAFEKGKRGLPLTAPESAALGRLRVADGATPATGSALQVDAWRIEQLAQQRYPAVPAATLPPNPGPGKWVPKTEVMSTDAAKHQQRVTGVLPGQVYVMNGVEYDGIVVRPSGVVVLVEAKDRYSQFFHQPWFVWEREVTEKVVKQGRAARAAGIRFEIHCSEQAVADRIRVDLVRHGLPRDMVVP